jgi:hypothetical protein|tara:strand:+ start:390 stop:803 length:414 start_codon:yes stop_codon:yes gene_type:complete
MITKDLKNIIKEETTIDLDSEHVMHCRDRENVEARAMYYALLRKYTNMTYLKIGKSVGKNHATVMHAANSLPFWLKQDEGLFNTYNRISNKFRKLLGYDETKHRIELNIEAILAQNLELKRQYEKLQKKYEQINMLD